MKPVRRTSAIQLVLIGLAIVGIGVAFYHHTEHLGYVDALYFSVVTLTTIGYGDIVPHTDAGKLFTVFYVLVGISLLAGVANLLLRMTVAPRIEKRNERIEKRQAKRKDNSAN